MQNKDVICDSTYIQLRAQDIHHNYHTPNQPTHQYHPYHLVGHVSLPTGHIHAGYHLHCALAGAHFRPCLRHVQDFLSHCPVQLQRMTFRSV